MGEHPTVALWELYRVFATPRSVNTSKQLWWKSCRFQLVAEGTGLRIRPYRQLLATAFFSCGAAYAAMWWEVAVVVKTLHLGLSLGSWM